MAKKKSKSSKSIEDKLYLIDKYAKANPDIPLGPIRYAILNDVSTPEFSVINSNVYANPFLAKQIENAAPAYDARQEEIEKYPEIPYIKDKEIRLTKGRYNTGKISTNLLDSIYDSASRVEVPFEIALGLAGRESTLGIGRGFKEGQGISPTELMSNWQQVQTIINPNSANDKISDLYEQYRQGIPISSEEFPFIKKYYDNERKEFESTRPITENPIDNALKYYIEGNYNKGDSRHTKMVEEDGRILMTEPAIQKWLSTKKAKGGKINRGKAANMAKNVFDDGGYVYDSNYGLENVLSDLKNNEQNIINNYLEGQDKTALLQDAAKNLLPKNKTDWNSVASVASAAMPVVDSVINPKRNTTTAGNIIQGIGGAVSMINPVVGLAIQGAGMLTNAAFGSNIDDSKVKAYETQADAVANTTFGGSTNEQLLSQYQAMTPLDSLNKDDIGSEGWLSNKATNKVNELNKEREAANTRMLANFDLAVNNLEQQNLMYDMANYAKYGGPLFNEFSNGITKINEGGSHSENPYEGVQVGLDPEGIPNLVEEGEIILGPEITKDNSSFVMSDSTKVSRGIRTKYKLRENITHADAAKEVTKMSEEMPNDPIVRRTNEIKLQELMIDQEQVKMKKDKNKRKNRFDYGGLLSPLEYAEPGLSISHAIQSAFTKPDYSPLNAYDNAIDAANIRIDSSPVKPNIEYTPLDTRSPLTEMSANRAATTRALMNTSGANPAIARTALTNADYNYNNQLGKLWRSIEEAEYNRQLGFEQFRTNLENANKARDLQAQSFTADILAKQAGLRGDFANKQLAIDKLTSEVKSSNIDAAKQALAGLARQDTYSRMLQMLKDEGYFYNPEKYKDLLARLDALEGDSKNKGNQSKYGGRIKRKRRLS